MYREPIYNVTSMIPILLTTLTYQLNPGFTRTFPIWRTLKRVIAAIVQHLFRTQLCDLYYPHDCTYIIYIEHRFFYTILTIFLSHFSRVQFFYFSSTTDFLHQLYKTYIMSETSSNVTIFRWADYWSLPLRDLLRVIQHMYRELTI